MTKAWDIVGYAFKADTYCPDHIVEQIDGQTAIVDDGENVESKLDYIAMMFGIDRQDERTFDSGDFPKVIFCSQVEDAEYCSVCRREID